MSDGTVRVVVRQLLPDEWRIHRQVRLSALRTNPEAFGASVRSSEQLLEEDWRRRTDALSWLARVAGEPAGMVGLWFDSKTKPIPEIITCGWTIDVEVSGGGE